MTAVTGNRVYRDTHCCHDFPTKACSGKSASDRNGVSVPVEPNTRTFLFRSMMHCPYKQDVRVSSSSRHRQVSDEHGIIKKRPVYQQHIEAIEGIGNSATVTCNNARLMVGKRNHTATGRMEVSKTDHEKNRLSPLSTPLSAFSPVRPANFTAIHSFDVLKTGSIGPALSGCIREQGQLVTQTDLVAFQHVQSKQHIHRLILQY